MNKEHQEFIEVNKENITEVLEKYPLVVIEFRTGICSPCTVMERETLKPIIGEIAKTYHRRVVFGRVIIDRNPELAQRFDVMASMTFLLFKDGKLVDRIFGTKAKDILEDKIRENLSN